MARSKKQRANDKRLGRLAKLRGKRPGVKSKVRVKRRRSSKRSVAKRTKGSRRSRASNGIKQFTKGFLGGNGAGELADELTTFVTVDPRIKIPVKIMASTAGGYYVGGKGGLIGGLVAAGLDIGLSLMNGKDFFNSGAPGQSRL